MLLVVLAVAVTIGDGRAATGPCKAGCTADKARCLATAAGDLATAKTGCPASGADRRRCLRRSSATYRGARTACARLRTKVCLPCCRAGSDGCSGLPTTTTTSSTTSTTLQRVAVAFDGGDVDTTLGTTTDLPLTVTSYGVAGPVTLSVTGLPSTWTPTFSPSASVPIAVDGTAHPVLHVSVPANGDATMATVTVVVSGGGVPDARDEVGMTVENEVVLVIPAGTGSTGNHGFPATLTMRVGTTLSVRNDDTTPHLIHGDGPIPHQDTSGGGLQLGQAYDVTPHATGTAHVYCHFHGQATGQTVVTVTE